MTHYEIDECFRRKTPSDMEAVLKIVDLLVNKDAANNKILALYNLLGQELFVKVCFLLDGDKLELPTAETMAENMTFAVCYLERFALNMDWHSIKKKYPSLSINTLRFSSTSTASGFRFKTAWYFSDNEDIGKNTAEVKSNTVVRKTNICPISLTNTPKDAMNKDPPRLNNMSGRIVKGKSRTVRGI